MKYTLKINPVNMQDRAAFLDYLSKNSVDGYEATKIYRSCTVFQRTGTSERHYSMKFVEKDTPAVDRKGNLVRFKGDVVICAADAQDACANDRDWYEAVSKDHDRFTGRHSGWRISMDLLLMAARIGTRIAEGKSLEVSESLSSFSDGFYEMWAERAAAYQEALRFDIPFYLFLTVFLIMELFALLTNRMYAKRIRALVSADQAVSFSPSFQKAAFRSNCVQLIGLALLVVILAVRVALIFWG